MYRVGSLDVGVVAQQPGAVVTPWTRMTLVMPLQGSTSGEPIHTTRLVPGTQYVRRRYGVYMSIELLKKLPRLTEDYTVG